METYRVTYPAISPVPILLSIPHCGTDFPDEIREQYVPELIAAPDDTDWFVDKLYNFAPSLGITTISAVFSRWVIDLNRHPESEPLYHDGRIITALCPVTTFLGEPLYRDKRKAVSPEEVGRRTALYFNPYHEKLTGLVHEFRVRFGQVLLWDCHSIRQVVPTIQRERFPDLILGSADRRSSHPRLIDVALKALDSSGQFTLQHNYPFKGGYITRHYGDPSAGIHALQLEMNKTNYMDDSERNYHERRAEEVARLLKHTLRELAECMKSIKD